MQVGASTYCFRDSPLGDALDRIAAVGLRDVEVWLGHCPDGSRAAVELARRRMRAVAVAAGGVYAPGGDAVARGAALARELGARLVVACVAPGLLPGIVRELDPRVRLCVENHWDQRLAHADDLVAELATSPAAAACLDTGHALSAGDDPSAYARALGARLGHVHLKDAAPLSRPERLAGRRLRRRLGWRPGPVPPGTGALDISTFAATLARLGYSGVVSFEYEGPHAEAALAALARTWAAAAS